MERWHSRRDAELREPDSWLTLIGLHWLFPGETRLGSAPRMEVVLPGEGVPAWVGTLTMRGSGSFDWEYTPEGAKGKPAGEATARRFRVDGAEGSPVFRWGSLSWFVIERYGEYAIRLRDSQAQALQEFSGLESFPVDLKWRIPARFEPYDPPREIPMPNVLEIPSTTTSPGAAVFEVAGQKMRLDLTGEVESGSLFLVFGDETNGRETYPGGRFLSMDFGQALSQAPQPTHLASSTTGNPSGPMSMASNLHERMQSPIPRQPTVQTFRPPCSLDRAAQVCAPS